MVYDNPEPVVTILFTKKDKWGSKLIRKVTGEPVSHCAILKGLKVIHSSWEKGGVTQESFFDFGGENQIVYHVDIPIKNHEEFIKLLDKTYNKPYDILGFIYLGLRLLFPSVAPKANLWQITGMFLCTEFVTYLLDKKEDSQITPYKLYLKLSEEVKQDGRY